MGVRAGFEGGEFPFGRLRVLSLSKRLAVPRFGPRLDDGGGCAQLIEAVAPARELPAPSGAALRAKAPPFGYLAPLDSAGTVSPSSSGALSAASAFGQQLGDLLLQQDHLLERMAVAHCAVLALRLALARIFVPSSASVTSPTRSTFIRAATSST